MPRFSKYRLRVVLLGAKFPNSRALLRAEARLARRVPYDLDNDEKLDPMQVLEEAMRHFYRKAKIEELPGGSAISGLWTRRSRWQRG